VVAHPAEAEWRERAMSVLDYDLHVWLYENNPSGIFAPFNPDVV
jgi:hypothetical protein